MLDFLDHARKKSLRMIASFERVTDPRLLPGGGCYCTVLYIQWRWVILKRTEHILRRNLASCVKTIRKWVAWQEWEIRINVSSTVMLPRINYWWNYWKKRSPTTFLAFRSKPLQRKLSQLNWATWSIQSRSQPEPTLRWSNAQTLDVSTTPWIQKVGNVGVGMSKNVRP